MDDLSAILDSKIVLSPEELSTLAEEYATASACRKLEIEDSVTKAVIPMIYKLSIRNGKVSDDAFQRMAMTIPKGLSSYDPNKEVKVTTWLFIVLHSAGQTYFRDETRWAARNLPPEVLVQSDKPSLESLPEDVLEVSEIVANSETLEIELETIKQAWESCGLTENEKSVIRQRLQGMSQTEISSRFGVTRERIVQIETKGLKKLRRAVGSKKGYTIAYVSRLRHSRRRPQH
jgi:RNA polymerase sigma factor (sigma-70 family)